MNAPRSRRLCLLLYACFLACMLHSQTTRALTCDTTFSGTITDFMDQVSAYVLGQTGAKVVCVEPGTYSGCGTTLTMGTGDGGAVTIIGLNSTYASPSVTIDCGDTGVGLVNMNTARTGWIEGIYFYQPDNAASSFILSNSNAHLTLVNMRVSHHIAGSAVVVQITQGEVVVQASVFHDNVATVSGAVFQASGPSTLSIYNSTFYDNDATLSGNVEGACVQTSGGTTLVIEHITATDNVADRGGCLSVTGNGGSVVRGGYFSNNAARRGGALYTDSVGASQVLYSLLEVTDCYFVGNSALSGGGTDKKGGAMYMDANDGAPDGFYTEIRNVTAVSNSADKGGLLFIRGAASGDNRIAYGTLRNVLCVDNSAVSSGGCLYTAGDEGRITVHGSVFQSNSANSGGAHNGAGDSHAEFINCTISDNYGGVNGGAARSDGSVYMDSCVVADNNSGNGGHADANSPDAWILTNTTFIRGSATNGGAIQTSSNTLLFMYDCYFAHNSASNLGGAVRVAEGLVAERCVFEDNTADDAGGALDIYSDVIRPSVLEDCVVTRNTAGTYGGGIYATSSSTTIYTRGLVVTDNSAGTGEGGGICATGVRHIQFENAVFRRNTAGHNGGGLFLESIGSVLFTAYTLNGTVPSYGEHTPVVLTDNSADGGGGGLYLYNVQNGLDAYNWTVTGNTAANGFGGGVYCDGSAEYAFTGSVFDDNVVSPGDGGGVYISNTPGLSFNSCRMSNNSAATGGGGLAGVNVGEFASTNMDVSNNNAYNGGGFFLEDMFGTPTLTHSNFTHNTATSFGGGVAVNNGDPILYGLVVEGNSGGVGGGLFHYLGDMHVQECLLKDNTGGLGGAVFTMVTSKLNLTDNVYVDNTLDTLYVFICRIVYVHNIAVSQVEGNNAELFLFGINQLSFSRAAITSDHGGRVLELGSVTNGQITNALIGSDNTAIPAVTVADVSLDVTDSVLCASGAGVMQCSTSTFTGDVTACITDERPCFDECNTNDYCVPYFQPSTVPNAGCSACSGACVQGTDACDNTSSVCHDSTHPIGYTCDCRTGYNVSSSNHYACDDVDECALGTHDCAIPASCVNTLGSFTCDCPSGFTPISATDCGDVNECVVDVNGTICGVSGQCVNSLGSFTCVCATNYFVYEPYDDCTLCEPGRYIFNGIACLSCLGSTYTDVHSESACKTCPDNTKVNLNRTGCNCDDNLVNLNGTCVLPCGLGEYSITTVACGACPIGTYGSAPGVCTGCPGELTTATTGSTSFDNCTCPPGTALGAGNTCPIVCNAGTYYSYENEECLACPSGSYSNTSAPFLNCTDCPADLMTTPLAGATSAAQCECPAGTQLREEEGVWVCSVQCAAGYVRPTLLACEICGKGKYADEINGLECSSCPANTQSDIGSTDVTDCTCRVNYYVESGKPGQACKVCPLGAECAGGTAAPVAREGYVDSGKSGFVQCSPPTACQGANKCADGYEGDMCESCSEGYHRQSGQCIPCTGSTTLLFIVFVIGLITVCSALVFTALRSHSVIQATAFVIGINALQIVAQFGRLNIQWPPVAQEIFDILSFVSFNIELTAPECVTPAISNPFFLRFYLTMALPLLLLFTFGLIYVCYVVVTCTPLGESIPPRREFTLAVLQSLCQSALIVYLPLSSAVFEYFDCVPYGDGRVVSSSPDVACDGKEWKASRWVAAVFILLYPLGIPLIFGATLFYFRRRLSTTAFALRCGFLVNRYKEEVYYYELFVLFRKLAVSVAFTFVSESPFIEAGVAVTVLILTFAVHIKAKAYVESRHNRLETGCALFVEFVVVAGILFQDTLLSIIAMDAIIVTLLFGLVAIVVVAATYDSFLLYKEASEAKEDASVRRSTVRASMMSEGMLDLNLVATTVKIDASGRDDQGRTFEVIAAEDVFAQSQHTVNGVVGEWEQVGEGVSTLMFCRDYSSLQYFIRAVSKTDKLLFEHNITVEARYHIAAFRTHEILFSPTHTVAVTFNDLTTARTYAEAMCGALPVSLGYITGLEIYENADGPRGDDRAVPAELQAALTAAKAKMADCVAAARVAGYELPPLESVRMDYVRDIGAGGFGAVKLYMYGGEEMAVKVNTHAAETKGFIEEAVVLLRLNHPNIIKLSGVCVDMLALGTEFCSQGDVFHLLKDTDGNIDLRTSLHILFETAKALTYMHEECGMAHRDIKPHNILLGQRGEVKLADFGLAGELSQPKYGMTRRYAAPEQFHGACGDYASDVYSFGVTMFQIISGTIPFREYPRFGEDGKILKDATPYPRGATNYNRDGKLAADLCNELAGVIERGCWEELPSARPTMRYVLETLAMVLAVVDPQCASAVSVVRSSTRPREFEFAGFHTADVREVRAMRASENVPNGPSVFDDPNGEYNPIFDPSMEQTAMSSAPNRNSQRLSGIYGRRASMESIENDPTHRFSVADGMGGLGEDGDVVALESLAFDVTERSSIYGEIDAAGVGGMGGRGDGRHIPEDSTLGSGWLDDDTVRSTRGYELPSVGYEATRRESVESSASSGTPLVHSTRPPVHPRSSSTSSPVPPHARASPLVPAGAHATVVHSSASPVSIRKGSTTSSTGHSPHVARRDNKSLFQRKYSDAGAVSGSGSGTPRVFHEKRYSSGTDDVDPYDVTKRDSGRISGSGFGDYSGYGGGAESGGDMGGETVLPGSGSGVGGGGGGSGGGRRSYYADSGASGVGGADDDVTRLPGSEARGGRRSYYADSGASAASGYGDVGVEATRRDSGVISGSGYGEISYEATRRESSGVLSGVGGGSASGGASGGGGAGRGYEDVSYEATRRQSGVISGVGSSGGGGGGSGYAEVSYDETRMSSVPETVSYGGGAGGGGAGYGESDALDEPTRKASGRIVGVSGSGLGGSGGGAGAGNNAPRNRASSRIAGPVPGLPPPVFDLGDLPPPPPPTG